VDVTVIVKAPAKINLGLTVLDKRDDGFHNILSIFQTVDLFDELTISEYGDTGLFCSQPSIPTGPDNLVIRAESCFLRMEPSLPRASFSLEKRIPVGAGLAGGSSDAAAALKGLRLFHRCTDRVDDRSLYTCACELGSDVPFFLTGGTAVVRGRGEIVEKVQWPFDFTYVIVYPDISISTAWAYRRIRPTGHGYSPYCEMVERFTSQSISSDEFLESLVNDFEQPVFLEYPDLHSIKQSVVNSGAARAVMTGSGSSIVGIFTDSGKAELCADDLRKNRLSVFVVISTKE